MTKQLTIQEQVSAALTAFIMEDDRIAKLAETVDYGHPFTNCTNGAKWLKHNFFKTGKVMGFSSEDNKDAQLGWEVGGHDFLVVDDRYIIDFWPIVVLDKKVFPGLFDLQNPEQASWAKTLYGDKTKWEAMDEDIIETHVGREVING